MTYRPRRAILGLALALGLGLQVAIVPPVGACSCMAPQPMAAYAGDGSSVIFTGVVEPRDARGFPVTVTRWFQGGGVLESRIWLDPAGFGGDGASCGLEPLPAGGEWIFVAYRAEDQRDLGLNLCSPHASAGDPNGEAMLADAVRTFGGPVVPSADPPPSTGAPAASAPGLGEVLVPVAIGLVAFAGVALGLVLVLGRRRGN
jgi:hypothetical protein